ncbi:MAG: ribosome maturation factor RimM [Gammaproteobacteria bacterium]
MSTETKDRRHVILGRINGLSGVRGRVKVFSYTRPREQIFSYNPWLIKFDSGWVERNVQAGASRGRGLSVLIEGIHDREEAGALIGSDIAVYRKQLAPLPDGEFYWCDLIRLQVFDQKGDLLGKIVAIQETGANDVLVVQGKQRLFIPLLIGSVIKEVDLDKGRVQLDWDPGFN